MAELTYIEHLNIPVKYRGNILHAYEYNATVGKINEIVDSLHTTYEFNKDFPRFDKIDDIFASTGAGTPVMINNEYGKLYPITSSAYILIDNTKNLDDELALLNSQITSGLTDALNKINQANELIERNLEYSYIRAQSLVSELRENVSSQINDVETNVSSIYTELTDSINDTKELSYAYSYSLYSELQEYVNQLNTELTGIVQELAAQHTIDVSNILSYIPSYVAGFGINISYENEISVDTSSIVDNNSIYVNELGQLVANNEVDTKVNALEDRVGSLETKVDALENVSAPHITGYNGISVTETDAGATISIAHSTAEGYKHIPTGGSDNQVLKYDTAGTATWSDLSEGLKYEIYGAIDDFTLDFGEPTGTVSLAKTTF